MEFTVFLRGMLEFPTSPHRMSRCDCVPGQALEKRDTPQISYKNNRLEKVLDQERWFAGSSTSSLVLIFANLILGKVLPLWTFHFAPLNPLLSVSPFPCPFLTERNAFKNFFFSADLTQNMYSPWNKYKFLKFGTITILPATYSKRKKRKGLFTFKRIKQKLSSRSA